MDLKDDAGLDVPCVMGYLGRRASFLTRIDVRRCLKLDFSLDPVFAQHAGSHWIDSDLVPVTPVSCYNST